MGPWSGTWGPGMVHNVVSGVLGWNMEPWSGTWGPGMVHNVFSGVLGWNMGPWGGSQSDAQSPQVVHGVIIHSCHLLSYCMQDLGSQHGLERAIKQRYRA